MRRFQVQDLTKLGSVSEMVWYRVSSNHAKLYAFIIFLNWTIAARLLRRNRNQPRSVALTSTIYIFFFASWTTYSGRLFVKKHNAQYSVITVNGTDIVKGKNQL